MALVSYERDNSCLEFYTWSRRVIQAVVETANKSDGSVGRGRGDLTKGQKYNKFRAGLSQWFVIDGQLDFV